MHFYPSVIDSTSTDNAKLFQKSGRGDPLMDGSESLLSLRVKNARLMEQKLLVIRETPLSHAQKLRSLVLIFHELNQRVLLNSLRPPYSIARGIPRPA